MNERDERLVRQLVEAAEAVETELGMEGARSLREEEQRQMVAITDELETLSLAVPFDTDDEAMRLRP